MWDKSDLQNCAAMESRLCSGRWTARWLCPLEALRNSSRSVSPSVLRSPCSMPRGAFGTFTDYMISSMSLRAASSAELETGIPLAAKTDKIAFYTEPRCRSVGGDDHNSLEYSALKAPGNRSSAAAHSGHSEAARREAALQAPSGAITHCVTTAAWRFNEIRPALVWLLPGAMDLLRCRF